MDAKTVFEMATLGGAQTLGIAHRVGSIEVGKEADLVLLDLNNVENPLEGDDLYSSIVQSGSPGNVRSVMVDGRWLYRDGALTFADEEHLLERARRELKRLLGRVS